MEIMLLHQQRKRDKETRKTQKLLPLHVTQLRKGIGVKVNSRENPINKRYNDKYLCKGRQECLLTGSDLKNTSVEDLKT